MKTKASGGYCERAGRMNIVRLGETVAGKRNVAARMGERHLKGIEWFYLKQSDSRQGLQGDLLTKGPVVIKFLHVSHFDYGLENKMPLLNIWGTLFLPSGAKIDSIYEPDGVEVVNVPWTAENYPVKPLDEGKDYGEGIMVMQGASRNMIIDLALVISFSKAAKPGRRQLRFGIPLGCPVKRYDRRQGGASYFLFNPSDERLVFESQFPATRTVFPKGFPGRMHVSLGIAMAELRYVEEVKAYITNFFLVHQLLNFPTVDLRDIKRLKGLPKTC